jgi:hypothetical protein
VNELFIALYLDEDMDVLIADFLRARGFRATTTHVVSWHASGVTEV